MIKYFFIIIIFIIFIIYNDYQKTHVFYGDIVSKEYETKKGLMFRGDKLKFNEGMLFVMNYQINSMWMKNTYIPLDIIFLDHSMKIIGYIEDTQPLSLESLMIDKPSKYVLEVNSGTVMTQDIRIGDHIQFIDH
jgi:uncharacterized protein